MDTTFHDNINPKTKPIMNKQSRQKEHMKDLKVNSDFADPQWPKTEKKRQMKKAKKALDKAKSIERERLNSGEWHYVTVMSKVGKPKTVLRRKYIII